nr:hypothetical protein [Baekduia soli]
MLDLDADESDAPAEPATGHSAFSCEREDRGSRDAQKFADLVRGKERLVKGDAR